MQAAPPSLLSLVPLSPPSPPMLLRLRRRRRVAGDFRLTDNYAVVVTTINAPTRAVMEIQDRSPELDAQFYVIGDSKSPPDFNLPGSRYLDLAAQEA